MSYVKRYPFKHCAVLITLFFFTSYCRADEPLPDIDSDLPEAKEVENDLVWGVETSYRTEHLYPSNWGQAGIFRIRSAESLPPGALTFGIGGEFYAISDAPDLGYGNTRARTIAESLFVGYSPLERLTLAIMRRNSSTTFGNPQQLISSLGDMNFSGMYSFPLTPSTAIAPIINVLVASNFNNLAPGGNTVSIGTGIALSHSLYHSLNVPLFLHANLIYHIPQIRTEISPVVEPETFFSFSRYHTVTLGLGAEYKLGDFIPFMELSSTVHTNSALNLGRSPATLSVGSRITPIANKSLAVLLGVDIGLSRKMVPGVPFTPGYQILGQISYTVALTSTERKHYFTTKDVNIV
ncbi:MAG: hypothetical protein HY537_06825, partial [Deltaproteobacteria bacterium]|nr:hypothetical protein [Deltaproteobacteria bacterium]